MEENLLSAIEMSFTIEELEEIEEIIRNLPQIIEALESYANN